MFNLPKQINIDINSFSNLFKNTHTSYKYLFFQAILVLLKEYSFTKSNFTFLEIEEEMLKIAEYPIKIYKLNFGKDDRISIKLYNKYENIDLLKFVPYRLLSPFFTEKLKGLSNSAINKKIELLSHQENEYGYNSLYKIDNKTITIYDEWIKYIAYNFSIIESWSFWNWANFLQNKNPNTLSLINKLQKTTDRVSLNKQTKYWKTILNKENIRCIYSGEIITPETFSLDHFLPWSFIGHDKLWNLIPMRKNDNSSKSDNIPSINKYLENFIETQYYGLQIAYNEMGKTKWENSITDFIDDFKIDYTDIRSIKIDKFSYKYKDVIIPLFNLAKNSDFNYDWEY